MYKKILSSLFLFVLLIVSGLFLFAKDASAQTLTVSTHVIKCENNPVTFTASGLTPGTWRVKLVGCQGTECDKKYGNIEFPEFPAPAPVHTDSITFNVGGECGSGISIEPGAYEARLHLQDGPAWVRKAEVPAIAAIKSGGPLPGDPDDPDAPASTAPKWYDQSFSEWQAKVYGSAGNEQEIFGERYTAAQVQWVIYALVHNIMNMTGDGDIFACINNPSNSGDVGGVCGPAVEAAAKRFGSGDPDIEADASGVLDTMFEPRAISFVGYVRGVGERITNFVPEAHAQTGFGFTAFNPVQKLWRSVRNATYLLLVLVIVVMAFMIMFRTKINPQTVISVQSALPKIIIALILITFSYAIAGLMVDLMYVVIGIIAAIFTAGGEISTMPWAQFFGKMTNDNSAIGLYLAYWFWALIILLTTLPGAFGVLLGVGGAIATGGTLGWFLLIVLLVFMIFLVIVGIKVLWLLTKTYVTILLLVIFGPIQILAGTVAPKAGFGAWLKSLVANLAVYPVVATMYIIAFVFLSGAISTGLAWVAELFGAETGILPFDVGKAIDVGGTWRPPLTGSAAGMDSLLWLGASFGVVMMIPKAGDMVKSAIQGREFNFGNAFGAVAGGTFGQMKGSGSKGVGYFERGQADMAAREREAFEKKEHQQKFGYGPGIPGPAPASADRLEASHKAAEAQRGLGRIMGWLK